MKRMLAVVGSIVMLAGCDDGPPPGPPEKPRPEWTAESLLEAEVLEAALAASTGAGAEALTFRLAFGASADLDLYVSGPFEETVYYANTPSAIGGELAEDRRCVHDAPRIEVVRFAAPLRPGRYRVGVDYPHACGESQAPAPFVLEVVAPDSRGSLRGLARHRVFEPIVYELEVEAAPSRPTDAKVKR